MRWALLWSVKLYRGCVGPYLLRSCRFEPSCSAYAVLALEQKGVFSAIRLIAWRLARCQPWGGSGFDPVPMAAVAEEEKVGRE